MKHIKEPSLTGSISLEDSRGSFDKVLSPDLGFGDMNVVEIFWSVNSLGVVRGLHYQPKPHGGIKIVFVVQGAIADYCVNADPKHSEYGKVFYNEVRRGEASVIVPDGFAHGFQALEDNTIVGYATDHAYFPEHETGFNPLSHDGVVWPLEVSHISQRDTLLPRFKNR